MISILQDKDNLIARWVCNGLGFDTAWIGDNYTIGFVENGCLLGGLIFHNYRPEADVWWTIYAESPRWCSRRVLRFIFNMAFKVLKCRRISLLVDKSNRRCLSMVKRMGFQEEGCLRAFRDNGEDAVLLGMLRDECKWIV